MVIYRGIPHAFASAGGGIDACSPEMDSRYRTLVLLLPLLPAAPVATATQ
jgi:hypothetical protein